MMFSRTPYEEFHAETYGKFHELMALAAEVGSALHTPEIVLFGPPGSGKSALLESVLGMPLYDHATKRTVRVNLINNPACSAARVTLRRDPAQLSRGDAFAKDQVLEGPALSKAMAERNIASAQPVVLDVEMANTWNVTFIDTPALDAAVALSALEGGGDDAGVSATIQDMRMEKRLLLSVHKAGEEVHFLDVVNKLDPGYARTVFVHTHFDALLDQFPTNKELAKFCSGLIGNAPTFLVETPSEAAARKDGSSLQAAVLATHKAVLAKLEGLHYDRTMDRYVGVPMVRGHLLEYVWKQYMEGLPALLQHLASTRAAKQEALYAVKATMLNLDSFRMRNMMSTMAMSFLKDLETLIDGSVDGLPALNGMTLEEELDDVSGMGPWINGDYREIQVKASAWSLPWPEQRLFGRQQFERLLSQFRAIALHTRIGAVRPDAVACSAGSGPLTTASQLAWVASDIAQTQASRLLTPILQQLHARMLFVMERLVDLVEVVRLKRVRSAAKSGASSVFGGAGGAQQPAASDYPYFFHQMRDVYMRYVQRVGEKTLAKCKDEFYCTRIVYWDMLNFGDYNFQRSFKDMSLDDRKEECLALANTLFADHRSRIVSNILMKYHNFFLSALQSDIWSEVQGEFAGLSDDEVSALFELDANQKELQQQQASLEKEFAGLGQVEGSLREAQMNFSHPR